jgi:hypothetical protein
MKVVEIVPHASRKRLLRRGSSGNQLVPEEAGDLPVALEALPEPLAMPRLDVDQHGVDQIVDLDQRRSAIDLVSVVDGKAVRLPLPNHGPERAGLL